MKEKIMNTIERLQSELQKAEREQTNAAARVKALKAADVSSIHEIADEKVLRVRDTDGLKMYLDQSWILVRPSGTENILKIYAETYVSQAHLQELIQEAQHLL